MISLGQFLCVFFKVFEFFPEDHDSLQFCVLKFIYVLGMHFYETGRLWREDTGLIVHVFDILTMRSGHVSFLC